MTILLIASAAFIATLIGGFFALRFSDHLHLILGFSAGAVAGVALFDLLPEAFKLGSVFHSFGTLALFISFGFFGYLILDRLIYSYSHTGTAVNESRGFLGATILSLHSFFDGVAIGIGFQASFSVGLVVTAAVLMHDFSDGTNTVNVILHNGGGRIRAFQWLFIDAVAPILGAAFTLLFKIPETAIGLILALFVGTFLYLSAADLIPESYHRHPHGFTTVMTILGALTLYVVVHLAS